MHFWTFPFSANGSDDYEVRVTFDGWTFRVKAFFLGRPANGFEYSVTMEVKAEMKDLTGMDAVQELVEQAKEHVRRKF